jgi:hypothetical protein
MTSHQFDNTSLATLKNPKKRKLEDFQQIKHSADEDQDNLQMISHRAPPQYKEESKELVRDSSKGDDSLETAAQSIKSSATHAGVGER